jgi:hypothetical protein
VSFEGQGFHQGEFDTVIAADISNIWSIHGIYWSAYGHFWRPGHKSSRASRTFEHHGNSALLLGGRFDYDERGS